MLYEHFRSFTLLVWQGQKDLNPRHSVLETDALPTELYPYIYVLFPNRDSARRVGFGNWWTVRGSNPGPTGYEPAALPTELAVRF